MKFDKKSLLLYAVTDRNWLGEKTLAMQVEEALTGGATCIQLREKNLDKETFLAEALEIQKHCKKHEVPFIINDNVDIAIKCGAEGIHVGQEDMQAKDVRNIIGDKMILGVSVQTVEQAVLAQQNGADYLGVGAVFTTSTKPDADIVSLTTLKAICDAVSIPVVAIGGIDKHNMYRLKDTNIDGVALVSAIFGSEDISKECKELLDLSIKVIR